MTDQTDYLRQRVQKILPDIEIQSIEMHQEGLVNDVAIVNNTWVVRFTKTEFARELMDMEYLLLRLLEPAISLPIPKPEKFAKDVLIYPHIAGHDFTREIWADAPADQHQVLAEQLGRFLHELHGISTVELAWDVPHTLAPVSRDTWADIYERLLIKVEPLLLPHQVNWMQDLFKEPLSVADFFDFDPVLVHGDLASYHILYSPEKGRLNGVIDFGTAGLGDPATDLGTLISVYGESLVSNIEPYYPNYTDLLSRARFYAQAIELQWVLLGVESGEDYWYTAHLGGARDIGTVQSKEMAGVF
jgi:aminoglycoside 2''-phosphotransferase